MTKTSKEMLDMFRIVHASELSLDDSFLCHVPKTDRQEELKDLIVEEIKSGLADFRKPIMDPSEDKTTGRLYFKAGDTPALGHSISWYSKRAKELIPEKNSRIGSSKEYVAFLALRIKYLIEEENYELQAAWRAVCDESSGLGHYWTSEDAKHTFEPTGSRPVGDYFDLGNTFKILIEDDQTVLLAGGYYCYDGGHSPLSKINKSLGSGNGNFGHSIPWIICDI